MNETLQRIRMWEIQFGVDAPGWWLHCINDAGAIGILSAIPNYLEDHNAVYFVEDRLDGYMMPKYLNILAEVVGAVTGCFSHFHASAKHRTEALLKTFGKWEY